MISEEKNYIFVHINKTAGSSIERILKRYSRDFKKHQLIGQLMTMKIPNHEYFKFTVVRNPYDRWVSNYHFNVKRNHKTTHGRTFKDYVFSMIDESQKEPRLKHHLWYNSSWNWISDEKDILLVDYIMRFENLEADWKVVSTKLGIDSPLPKTNSSKHDHYSKYYDDETYDLVTRHCSKDLEFLGYRFENE
jgi:hypothetical protein